MKNLKTLKTVFNNNNVIIIHVWNYIQNIDKYINFFFCVLWMITTFFYKHLFDAIFSCTELQF